MQRAFSTQQLVHITVINLFELHHLRDLTAEPNQQDQDQDQDRSNEQDVSWFQLLGLFSEEAHCSHPHGQLWDSVLHSASPPSSVSFLGLMCSCELLNQKRGEGQTGVCPLPAIKVSLDWLKLRPGVFQEAALDTRQQ